MNCKDCANYKEKKEDKISVDIVIEWIKIGVAIIVGYILIKLLLERA